MRVKHGITDVEYPDMPMGGWAGTIHEIHDDGMYTVRWSQETLAAIHPVFKKRHNHNVVTLSLGELEVKKGKPNRKLVADYCYWFWNWR